MGESYWFDGGRVQSTRPSTISSTSRLNESRQPGFEARSIPSSPRAIDCWACTCCTTDPVPHHGAGSSRWRYRHERRSISRSPNVAKLGTPKSQDRKSTRLNSSHTVISYAVFCLKKKKQI